jgi:hypothetical protein
MAYKQKGLFKVEFKAIVENSPSSLLWNYFIRVPLEIAEKFIDADRRVICILNHSVQIQCALMPDKGIYFIMLNQEVRKKLKADTGTELSVELKKDQSEYGIYTCDEFLEILAQDDAGKAIFHTLTPGKQRTLIHVISKPKSSQIRINKGLAIINYLKTTNGTLDFKELNQYLKVNK